MTWMLMIYLVWSTQSGIYRDRLFSLQDQWLQPPAQTQTVSTTVSQPETVTPASVAPVTGKATRGRIRR